MPQLKTIILSAGFIAGFGAGAGAALAQDITAEIMFYIVDKDAAGEEILVERTDVGPGEIIHYELTHANAGEGDVTGLTVVGLVPEGTTFTPDAIDSSFDGVFEVQAEMDPENEGLEWSTLPATRIVENETGERVEEPLPFSEIEMVRWKMDAALAGGETARNTYRVQVN